MNDRRRVLVPLLALLLVAGCDLSAIDPVATNEVPTPSRTPSAIPSFIRPTPTPLPTFLVHVVVRGDSLTTIAQAFGTSPESIAYWNRATYPSLDPESPGYAPDSIKAGWVLVLIPFAEVDPEDLPPPEGPPSGSPAPDEASPSAEG